MRLNETPWHQRSSLLGPLVPFQGLKGFEPEEIQSDLKTLLTVFHGGMLFCVPRHCDTCGAIVAMHPLLPGHECIALC